MSGTHQGSCLCGAVRFEIAGAFEGFFLCHCGRCRKATGSAHAANLFSTTATLNWLAGHERVKAFNLPSTRHTKSFCVECGAAMPNLQMNGALLVVPAGSLDTEIDIPPTAHIMMASKAGWDDRLEDAPKLDGLPG